MYIEREALLEIYKKWIPQLQSEEDAGDLRGVETCIAVLEDQPTANVVEVPQEYVYYTDFDDESYLVHFSFPISEKQFKAFGEGADLWETLRMDGESDG